MRRSYHAHIGTDLALPIPMAYRKTPSTLAAERRLLAQLRRELAAADGNRARAAKAMGISERQVYRLIRKLESKT